MTPPQSRAPRGSADAFRESPLTLRAVYLRLVATAALWGGTFPAGKLAVRELPPLATGTLRFALATAALALLLALHRRRASRLPIGPDPAQAERGHPTVQAAGGASREGCVPEPDPGGASASAGGAAARRRRQCRGRPAVSGRSPLTARQIGLLAFLGATGVFAYNVGFLVGLTLAPSVDAALLIPPNNPLATAILAAVLLGEPITRRVAAGLALAFVGVALVVAAGVDLAFGGKAGVSRLAGDALFLAAVLGWALYTVVGRVVLAELTPLEATTWSSAFGTLGLAAASLAEGRWGEVAGASPVAWVALAYLAFFGTVVGFVWWYQGVVRIGAARAAAFVNLVPVFGLSASALLLGERLAPWQLAGAVLVMTGVLLTTTGRRGSPPPAGSSAGETARARHHAGPQTT